MIITDTIHTSLLKETPIKYTLILPSVFRKSCLWLHGYKERSENLLANSNLEYLAEQHQIAIILPDVPDTYYLDQPWRNCYTEQFLIFKFLPAVTTTYNLPASKSDTYIAGISMGGFGSLLLGSHFCDLFSKIISISGAFIINDIVIGNPEVIGSFQSNLEHFENIFGNIASLENSYFRNPAAAACHMLKNRQLPQIFMTCGTEDLLFSRNIRLRNLLLSSGADITWMETNGNHNWKFFNRALNNAFNWLSEQEM